MMAAMPAMAQLNNTVEVTNEVKPVVNDVKKVEIKTQPIKTEVKHYTMNYATQGETLNNFAPEPLGNYHSDEKTKGDKNGYIHLGGGSHGNADGRIAYKFGITNDDALNIDLSLNGFNGKTGEDERLYDTNWKSRFYTNRSAMRYDHFFSNGMNLYVKGMFENEVFNYRMTPILNISPAASTQGQDVAGAYAGATDKQHNTNVNACAGIEPWKTGKLTLAAEGKWLMYRQDRATSLQKGLGEDLFSLYLNADYNIEEQHSIGIEVLGDVTSYRNNELKSHSCVTFLPHYNFTTDDLHLKLGIFATSEGNVAPDISVNYSIGDSHAVYAEVKGYEIGNDLYYLSSMHPYFVLTAPANGKMEIEDEFHQVDAKIGYRFQKEGFGANVYGGYDMSEDHMDIIEMSSLHTGERMMPMIDFKKNKRIYFGADINYAYKDLVKVEGRNKLNIESLRQASGWEEGSFISPAFSMDWRADFKLMKGLYAGVDWNLYCYSLPNLKDSHTDHMDRKNTVNLGADVRYTLPVNTPVTLFVKGNNLLCQKYDRFYGYQNIGTNVLAGFAISF